MWKAVLAGLVAWVMIILTALALTAVGAYAHSYYEDAYCCNDRDCKPATYGVDVIVTPEGYSVPATGEVIPFRDSRVRPAPNADPNRFHLCILPNLKPLRVRCILVPHGGV
jgi:hypothetical protein